MIPYTPAVYIGPNGEQFPMGYHQPPMAMVYDQHQHPASQHQHQHQHHQHQHQHQRQQQRQPHHAQHPQHPQHPQHHQHQHPSHSQHFQSIHFHGPTSAPLPFGGTAAKPTTGTSGQQLSTTATTGTLENISTSDVQHLEPSVSLESPESSSSGSSMASPLSSSTSSTEKGDLKRGESKTNHQGDDPSHNQSPQTPPSFSRTPSSADQQQEPGQPSSTATPLSRGSRTESRQTRTQTQAQTSHGSNPPSGSASSAKGEAFPPGPAAADTSTDTAAAAPGATTTTHLAARVLSAAGNDTSSNNNTLAAASTHETSAVQQEGENRESAQPQQEHQDNPRPSSTSLSSPSSSPAQQHSKQVLPPLAQSAAPPFSQHHHPHHLQSYTPYPSSQYAPPAAHITISHSGAHPQQPPFPPPASQRPTPASPYYHPPSRQNPSGHSKQLSGQHGQGPGGGSGGPGGGTGGGGGVHGTMAMPSGLGPVPVPVPPQHHPGYGVAPLPPQFFGPAVPQAPSTAVSPGSSRRAAAYSGQAPHGGTGASQPPTHPPGAGNGTVTSPSASGAGTRSSQPQHQQYGGPSGFKQPFLGQQGYSQDYTQHQHPHSNQHPHHPNHPTGHFGGVSEADHWPAGPAPTPTLQKKPKELDKAMWVGNVLSDTTQEELRAIFEAEPTEEEGDIEHDVPESIFILSKSNCAFVNYSSHEAVDRAVRRFHDREFKNTRLVCRPRKDPGSDPYSNKMGTLGRYQQHHHPSQGPHHQHHHQHHHHHHLGQPPYMPESMGYYGGDQQPYFGQRMDPGNDHHLPLPLPQHHHQQQQNQYPHHHHHPHQHPHHQDLAEAQTRMERMRLEGSPMLDSSSSGGEGSAAGQQTQAQQHQQYPQRKDKGNSKKPRSPPSFGYAETRYFIMKGLSEEDLKLSVQYGLWATQEHLVKVLNDAYANSKDVYLVFSANKSGEFFGYARMMDHISVENEVIIATGKENEIWQPTVDVPISPELKAAMLEEIEKAEREGRKVTNEEAEIIARNSTTTKSWGIRFPVKWLCVHKVPFSKTSHMLNRLYDNREVKVSKDGTEVDTVVGEQLLELFKKSKSQGQGRGSISGQGSRSDSGESRRSSVTGDSSTLAPPPSHRSPSSRRSSIISTRSTGSISGGDRRASMDRSSSRSQGSSFNKSMSSPLNAPNRGQTGGDGNVQTSGAGGYRGTPSKHGHYGSYSSNSSQGPYSADQHPDQQRAGWGSKPSYRGGGAGGYGSAPMSGGTGIPGGGYYPTDHNPGPSRKNGPGGTGGGKYNSAYHSSVQHAGYEHPPFHSQQIPRRHNGPPLSQQYPGSYRPNTSPPGTDSSVNSSSMIGGNSGYNKHSTRATSPSSSTGSTGQQGGGTHDQGYTSVTRASSGAVGHNLPPNHQLGGQVVPPHHHSTVYTGQGPPPHPPPPQSGYHHPHPHAPFAPPGYHMMPTAYMGYSYVPGPTPLMHGAPMAWHHQQQHPGHHGPPVPPAVVPGMIPGAGMVPPGHPASIPPMPGASIDGHPHGLEGMVPWIGYDGVTYGYMTAEEAYHQMYGYNYMAHVSQTGEPVETDIQLGEEEAGKEDDGDEQQQQQKKEADKEVVEEQVVPASGQSQGCEDDEGDRPQVSTSSVTDKKEQDEVRRDL